MATTDAQGDTPKSPATQNKTSSTKTNSTATEVKEEAPPPKKAATKTAAKPSKTRSTKTSTRKTSTKTTKVASTEAPTKAAKTPAKAATKTPAKATTKTTAKAAAKTPAKAAAKTAAKTPAKATTKTAAKSSTKSTATKRSSTKASAKKAEPEAKAETKPKRRTTKTKAKADSSETPESTTKAAPKKSASTKASRTTKAKTTTTKAKTTATKAKTTTSKATTAAKTTTSKAKSTTTKAKTTTAKAKAAKPKTRATRRSTKTSARSTRRKSADSEAPKTRTRRQKKPLVSRSEADLMLDRASRAIRLRDFAQAKLIFEKVIAEYPDDVRGYVYLAQFFSDHGKRDAALKEFNRALRRKPSSVMALAGKAEFLENQNPPKTLNDALKIYRSILANSENETEEEGASKHKALAEDRIKYCEARKLSLQSRKHMKPDNPRTLRKARKLLHEALEMYPADKRNSMNLGVAYLWSKDYAEARKYFLEAINKDQKYARAYLNLGHAYNGLGHLRRARDAYRSCLELTTHSGDAEEARGALKVVERKMARCRHTFHLTLTGRAEKKNMLSLCQMKNMITMLTGDDIDRGDVARKADGSYTVLAYSLRSRYNVAPGPEGLKITRDHVSER